MLLYHDKHINVTLICVIINIHKAASYDTIALACTRW